MIRASRKVVEPAQILFHNRYNNEQIRNEVGDEAYKCKWNENIYKGIRTNPFFSLHPRFFKLGINEFPLIRRINFLFNFVNLSFGYDYGLRRILIQLLLEFIYCVHPPDSYNDKDEGHVVVYYTTSDSQRAFKIDILVAETQDEKLESCVQIASYGNHHEKKR